MKEETSLSFKVLTAESIKSLYPEGEALPTVDIDPRFVPKELRSLIPLALRWGISDDILRGRAYEKASEAERAALVQTIRDNEDALDFWLAGPEADNPTLSKEYVAFSNMRLAADGC